MKIQDLFAKVGGLYSGIFLFLKLFISSYIEFLFYKNVSRINRINNNSKRAITINDKNYKNENNDMIRTINIKKEARITPLQDNYIKEKEAKEEKDEKEISSSPLTILQTQDSYIKGKGYFNYLYKIICCKERFDEYFKEEMNLISFETYMKALNTINQTSGDEFLTSFLNIKKK